MATNPPLQPPGPIGGDVAGAGILLGAAQNVGSLFQPAAQARAQNIALQQQRDLTAAQISARAGRAARPPTRSLDESAKLRREREVRNQKALDNLRDPAKALGLLKSVGKTEKDLEEFTKQLEALKVQSAGSSTDFTSLAGTIKNLPTPNADRVLAYMASLESGTVDGVVNIDQEALAKSLQLTVDSPDPIEALRQRSREVQRVKAEQFAKIDAIPDATPLEKAGMKKAASIVIADASLDVVLKGEARPRVQAIPPEGRAIIGSAFGIEKRPKNVTALGELGDIIENQRNLDIESQQQGVLESVLGPLEFRNEINSQLSDAIVSSGMKFKFGEDVEFKPPTVFGISVGAPGLGGQSRKQLGDTLKKNRLKKILESPEGALPEDATPDEAALAAIRDRVLQNTATTAEEKFQRESQLQRRQALGLAAAGGQVATPQLQEQILAGEAAGQLAEPGLLPGQPEAGAIQTQELVPELQLPGPLPEDVSGGARRLLGLPELFPPIGTRPEDISQAPGRLERERARITARPETAPSIPPKVARLAEELLLDKPLSQDGRRAFADAFAAAFDPEDIDELADEVGFENEITGPLPPPGSITV